MDGYLIAGIVLLAWFIVLIAGWKLKFWGKLHMSVYGPFLMIRTQKGRRFLDRLARPKRFWQLYGSISIWVCICSMLCLMVLLIWEAVIVLDIPSSAAPSPEILIGLPGINPIIPLWYGILGLVVAIVLHEFAHGIVSRASGIKVESMGLLFLIFPMGAFVEPNEAELKETSSKKRAWIYAVGPTTNVIVGLICLTLLVGLVAPSIQPVSDGAVVTKVLARSPAEHYGLSIWAEITAIEGVQIEDASEIGDTSFLVPGQSVHLEVLYKGQESSVIIPGGVVINSAEGGLPAHNAGIVPGMIIYSLNNTIIHNLTGFRSTIENETPEVPIDITVLSYGYNASSGEYGYYVNESVNNITLSDKWLYYQINFPDSNREEYRNKSYMGVTSSIFGISVQNPDAIINFYANPFANSDEPGEIASSALRLIGLPFLGFSPVESPLSDLFAPSGSLSFLPPDIYWTLFNSLYWIFWINLMVGLTNALPAIPLDGGYVFRDVLKRVIKKIRGDRTGIEGVVSKPSVSDEQIDKWIGFFTIAISFLVLFLILWQILGPRF